MRQLVIMKRSIFLRRLNAKRMLYIGYVTDNTQFIRGISPLHDSGTGSSLGEYRYCSPCTTKTKGHLYLWIGTYGNFEIMPLLCPDGFDTCTTTLAARERLRKNNTDGSQVFWVCTINLETLMLFCHRRLSRLFLSDTQQQYSDRSYCYSSCWPGTVHFPNWLDALLCARSGKWFARVFCRRKSHHWPRTR